MGKKPRPRRSFTPGPLFLSETRRNLTEPLTLWTWSKVVQRIALAAEVPRFSTHTSRQLCLTDLARMGWEPHAIATFAGHRSTDLSSDTSTVRTRSVREAQFLDGAATCLAGWHAHR